MRGPLDIGSVRWDPCLPEHISLGNLRHCLPPDCQNRIQSSRSCLNARPVSAKYAKQAFVCLELLQHRPASRNKWRRVPLSEACVSASPTASYNDVLSAGITTTSTEDAAPKALAPLLSTNHANITPRPVPTTESRNACVASFQAICRGSSQDVAGICYAGGSGRTAKGSAEDAGPEEIRGASSESSQKDGESNQGNSDSSQMEARDAVGQKSNASSDGEEEEEDNDEDDDEDEDGEDDGVVRCVCGERNDGELMIQCEICQIWQHTLCMGIRDEAHIPDKYYCEKCHPEDHPYINSRPRTMVLAEASATGTSSMMRRSAVMAVAKMTAREEYRSAAAAAAIAASVAAAATAPPSGKSATAAGGGNSRRSAKKPNATPRKAEVSAGGSMAQKQLSRRGRRNRRLSRGGADGDGAGESEGDYDVDDSDTKMHNTANNGLSSGSQNRGDGDDSQVERSKGTARRSSTAANSPLSARKAQPSKRVAARQTNGVSKRRKVGYQSPSESPDGVGTEQTSAERAHMGDIDCEDGGFAEDLVARVMGAKPGTPKSKSKVRTPRSRNRSISSAVKPSAGFDAEEDLANADYAAALTGLPRRRGSKSELHDRAGGRRRGKSEPGSPVQLSESPMLPLLLYAGGDCGGESSAGADGQSDIEESGRHTGHLSKRKRTGGTSRSSKHLRMTVSAANSPSLGDAAGFAAFTDAISRNRAATGLAGSEGENNGQSGDDCNAFSGGDGRGDDCDADEQASVQRQPKHNYPPLETVDVDGNRIVVPSNMLNTQGQPIYSSVASDTMCKIRYPHSRANLYELNRRAKQLLEWLGKAQSEYEQERVTWLPPLGSNNEETEAMPTLQSLSLDDIAVGNRAALTRGISHQISDAPTSPIHPSDWPADDNFDGESTTATTDVVPAAVAMVEADERQPRSTLSMMEDLMWRLIRFQETYSN